jgi:hypothetical protein
MMKERLVFDQLVESMMIHAPVFLRVTNDSAEQNRNGHLAESLASLGD